MKLLNDITPIEKDFAKWYQDVVIKGNLIAYGKAKGSMIFKPISYGMWENIQRNLDNIFKTKVGASNVNMPLLIPLSYIEKEKEHVKGFAPELATVTRVGSKDLAEPLVIRPTSEVLFAELFSKEVNSYNDLPIIFNQWGPVLRWEKTTNPFLRNREFLWQEGHTAHSNPLEARKFARKMIKVYAKFAKDFLAIPTIIGKKTSREKFAGAVTTYTIEAMMKDGKALQSGTSHYLGQNFGKSFNVQFKNKENKKEFIYQTSWGVSTRLIGALIMSHGDNRGIIIPPKIAPYQIDIIEIFGNKNPDVKKISNSLNKTLKRQFRVRVEDSNKGPGHKAAQSEIEGTPLRIEIGPRDIANGIVTIVRRDTLEKIQCKIDEVKINVKTLLIDIHNNLYANAQKRMKENTISVYTYESFKKEVNNKKFVIVPFAGNSAAEEKIQQETGATTRCIPLQKVGSEHSKCIITGKLTKRYVIFAKSY